MSGFSPISAFPISFEDNFESIVPDSDNLSLECQIVRTVFLTMTLSILPSNNMSICRNQNKELVLRVE